MGGWVRKDGRYFRPHKAVKNADFRSRNVLTENPFAYVRMWLARESQDDAGYLWQQAENFFQSAQSITSISSPLLYYYSFLNAVKALLVVKGVHFDTSHGLKRLRDQSSTSLDGVDVSFTKAGVAVSLRDYLEDQEKRDKINLKDLFGNILCIHRSFVLTFGESSEKFLPVNRPVFTFDENKGEMFLTMGPAHSVNVKEFSGRIPSNIVECTDCLGNVHFESKMRCKSDSVYLEDNGFDDLSSLNNSVRKRLVYIKGNYTPWYISTISENDVNLSQVTMILCVMHKLSELNRYEPLQLRGLMEGPSNWLIAEFLDRAPAQFIDELACEITGHQIEIPGVRQPKWS